MESKAEKAARSLHGLDWLNFLIADVQTGVGPFLAIYLAARGWNEERVGLALAIGGIAGIVSQTPAGALVDRLRSKRALIAAGVIALASGAILIAAYPSFWTVITAQVLIGAMSSFFASAIGAVSLGIVGYKLFGARQGRNHAFNSAGNVAAALLMGLIGYFASNRDIFLFVAALAGPTILSLALIRPNEIDYELARGARDGEDDGARLYITIATARGFCFWRRWRPPRLRSCGGLCPKRSIWRSRRKLPVIRDRREHLFSPWRADFSADCWIRRVC